MSKIAVNHKHALEASKAEQHKMALAALDMLPVAEKNKLLVEASQLKSRPATVKDTKHLWKKCKGGYHSITREAYHIAVINQWTVQALILADGYRTETFSVGDPVAFCSFELDAWHTHNLGHALGYGFSVISQIKSNGNIVLENSLEFSRQGRQLDGPNGLILYEFVINSPLLKEGPREGYIINNKMYRVYAPDGDNQNCDTTHQDPRVVDLQCDTVTDEWADKISIIS
jgi:hypothetical protein